MKLLYYGDLHLDKIPSSRTDNYLETQQRKINEIKKVAKDNNVTALLQGGDFFNKDIVSNEELTRVLSLWENFFIGDLIAPVLSGRKPLSELIDMVKNKELIPTIGVAGNHELTGGDIGALERSSLSVLIKNGFMTMATKEEPIILTDEEGYTVAITGSHYHHDIDGEDKSAYIVEEKLGDYHIHLVHGMLMADSYGTKFEHTTVSEIAYKTKADLTINGHDHIGYDLIELDGKKFINPGSPFRLSAEKKEIKRTPKILLLDISKDKGIEVIEHYLNVEKGEDVLTREHISKKIAKTKKTQEIEEVLEKAKLSKGVDVTEIVKKIALNELIDEDVSREAVDLITKKMNELNKPFNPPGEYIITNITIENFMSHKNTSLDLTDGLNILYGESRNGKSGILRAIKEVYECYLRNPREMIFYGEKYLKISLTLSNGYIVSRYVEAKKNGKNGYEIFNPNTCEINFYNTKSLGMVQEILGLSKINLTDKNKIGFNFLNQGDGWFFLGNSISAPDKAKIIGAVYGTHFADGVIKELNSKTKKVVTEIKFQDAEINKLCKEKDKFFYLEEYEKLLIESETLLKELESKEEVLNKLISNKNTLKDISNQIEFYTNIAEEIEKRETIYKPLMDEVISKNEKLVNIVQKNKERLNILRMGKEASSICLKLDDIDTLKDSLLELENKEKIAKEKKELLNKYMKLKNDCKDIEVKGVLCNKINKSLECIPTLQSEYEKLVDMKSNLEQYKKGLRELNDIQNGIEEKENSIKGIEKNTTNLISLYKDALTSKGKCPVCNGNITSVIIDSVVKSFED